MFFRWPVYLILLLNLAENYHINFGHHASALQTGLTFVDTKIVSVHESLRRREALKNGKYESSLKKSSFPVRLPPEEPEPPRTKKYFLSKFGLQNVQRQQKIFEDLRPSKTFLEEVPFSSITGRRVMKLRPTNVNPNEVSVWKNAKQFVFSS